MNQIDKCFYCGAEYHPMPVYVGQDGPQRGHVRYVCQYRYDAATGRLTESDCGQQAESDGYEYSAKLTPRR